MRTGLSTANLPNEFYRRAGQITGMQKAAEILERVQRRLDAIGKSADRASREAKSPDAIRNLKKRAKAGMDGAGWTVATTKKLAAVLETTVDWLLDGEGPESPDADLRSEDVAASLSQPPQGRTVQIKGYIGAAGEGAYYRYADETFEVVEAPAGATDRTIALEIKGTSWGPRVVNWLVFYDDVRSPVTPDLIGKTCIIGLADDRILLKEIRRNRNGGFDLYSNSDEPPIQNAQIEWAALMTGMRQR